MSEVHEDSFDLRGLSLVLWEQIIPLRRPSQQGLTFTYTGCPNEPGSEDALLFVEILKDISGEVYTE